MKADITKKGTLFGTEMKFARIISTKVRPTRTTKEMKRHIEGLLRNKSSKELDNYDFVWCIVHKIHNAKDRFIPKPNKKLCMTKNSGLVQLCVNVCAELTYSLSKYVDKIHDRRCQLL